MRFSTWSLAKLAEFHAAEGVVDDISHEGLRVLLGKKGVSFQAVKTSKESTDTDYQPKKNQALEFYDIAEGKAEPAAGDPLVVFSMDHAVGHLLAALDMNQDKLCGHVKANKRRTTFLKFCR